MEPKQYYLSPELAPRLAAIDIGTNSLRLIIAEAMRGGKYRVLDDEKEATRLGANLSATGRLDPTAVDASLTALRRMTKIAAGYQVQQTRAIATCAVREAADGLDFCQRVKDEIGLEIEVVSAKKEALLAFHSVSRAFDLEGKHVAVVDIGGGSTEIVLASGNIVEEIYTTPLGAVRLTELFGGAQSLTPVEFERLLTGADRLLKKHTEKPLFVPHLLIGSGGTFTALAAMAVALRGQAGQPVRGCAVSRADVRHLLERLRKLSPHKRRSVAGLSPERADIIVAGLAIIDSVMRRLKVNALQVHDGGVRDGLLLSMVGSAEVDGPPDRLAAAENFAARCGVDTLHARHVAHLAGSIFTQLCGPLSLSEEDQAILQAAAVLQDVGYLINYEQHHKHSYHLISNSHLTGYAPLELELIANVARYHRGAKPKRKHANFAALSPRDQLRVRQMAAVLRIAGGFDRSHSQQIRDVRVQLVDDEIHMHAVADEMPEVDVWGARRRAAFFEDVFLHPLIIEWEKGSVGPVETEVKPVLGRKEREPTPSRSRQPGAKRETAPNDLRSAPRDRPAAKRTKR